MPVGHFPWLMSAAFFRNGIFAYLCAMKYGTVKPLLFFILLLLVCPFNHAMAQENLASQSFHNFLNSLQSIPRNGEGSVTIQEDPRIVQHIIRFNEAFSEKKGIPGFRILIFFASGREARVKMRSENERFIKLYDNVFTYLDYDPPYFKIYVGDFMTRSAAEKFKQEIIGHFPKAFVRPARLRVPDLTK